MTRFSRPGKPTCARLPETRPERSALLRDHLGELLTAIAADLATMETTDRPAARGQRSTWKRVEALAAEQGAGRANEGFTVTELVPEFPALRFCTTQLWLSTHPQPTAKDLEDVARFDEAIDFALMQSVFEFMDRLNRSRETFLGVLGHDLRDPLATIITAARLLLEERLDPEKTRSVIARIASTGERMHHLVIDLLDFTRTRIDGRMRIQRRDADLADVIRTVAAEFTTSHPKRTLHVSIPDDLKGRWDPQRMSQALGNLVANALHHGAEDSPIDISAAVEGDDIVIRVHNCGPAIRARRSLICSSRSVHRWNRRKRTSVRHASDSACTSRRPSWPATAGP